MKNTLIILAVVIVFIIIYFLQANFFIWFNIAGVMPNLFVILVMLISLFAGKRVGVPFGIGIGICLDFFIGKKIGITGIMLGTIAVLGSYFDKNFSKDSKMTIILMTIASTFIYEVGIYIINIIIQASIIEIISFIKILLIEILYNIILVIILYPLMQKIGYFIEEAFRGSKILTRYF